MSTPAAQAGAPADAEPGKQSGRPWVDLLAVVLSAGALAVSAAGYLVADRADARQQRREEAEYAQRVVFSVEQRVSFGIPGEKPTIEKGVTVVVVNFGSFPVEDVVIEQSKRPSILLVDTVRRSALGRSAPARSRRSRQRRTLSAWSSSTSTG